MTQPKKKPMSTVAQPIRNDMRSGVYDGKELKRNPGIPDSRFKAFELPSIWGSWRVWPNGDREPI